MDNDISCALHQVSLQYSDKWVT